MISKVMNDALNIQVDKEMASSNLYLAMYGWLAENGLPGFAHWMREQAAEEYEHCMKIFDYILERGGSVSLGSNERERLCRSQFPAMVCQRTGGRGSQRRRCPCAGKDDRRQYLRPLQS